MSKNKTLVIAEAGVNHNGSLNLAKKMIESAKNAGADIIKFQTFLVDKLVTNKSPQFQILKKLELSFEDFILLSKACKKKKIEFLSTGFDADSVKFLNSIKQKRFKIPSGEITNYPLLRLVSRMRKEIILSTGMCSLKEVELALKVINKYGTPLNKITVLHCNSAYPTKPIDANLRAIETIKKKFAVNVGYSDHTLGIEAPIIAVSLGAKIIEKHFTLNRKFKGPDHRASIEPKDLKKMIEGIRKTESLLGSDKKYVTKSEKKNIYLARKSIVASKDIKKGEKYSELNLTTKRPGLGTSPMNWKKILGNKAKRNFKKDEYI